MGTTKTTNLNLTKPDKDEQYNVKHFNDNMDLIDSFAGQVPARALTADKLTTGANINGVRFDGTTDVTLPPTGADTDLSNLTTVGQSKFDAKVNKSGDNVTGILHFKNLGEAINLDNISATDTQQYQDIVFKDTNSYRLFGIRGQHSSSTTNNMAIYFCKPGTNTNIGNAFTVSVDSNGKFTYAPVQIISRWRASTTTANAQPGKAGYDIYSDGFCRQFGIGVCGEDQTSTIGLFKKLRYAGQRNIFTQMIWDAPITAQNSGPTIGVYDADYQNQTSFKVWANSSFASTGTLIYFFWEVLGYLATDQY